MEKASVCDEPGTIMTESSDLIHTRERLIIRSTPAHLLPFDDFAEWVQTIRNRYAEVIEHDTNPTR
jgi:hypothetical protein